MLNPFPFKWSHVTLPTFGSFRNHTVINNLNPLEMRHSVLQCNHFVLRFFESPWACIQTNIDEWCVAELHNINFSLSIQYQLFYSPSYQYQYQYQLIRRGLSISICYQFFKILLINIHININIANFPYQYFLINALCNSDMKQTPLHHQIRGKPFLTKKVITKGLK